MRSITSDGSEWPAATPGAGFPSHPHRGQATLTRIVSGAMDHADSTGREGRLFPGDIQYMEAGRGVGASAKPEI